MVRQTLNTFGKVDILINNAGILLTSHRFRANRGIAMAEHTVLLSLAWLVLRKPPTTKEVRTALRLMLFVTEAVDTKIRRDNHPDDVLEHLTQPEEVAELIMFLVT